MPWSRCFASRPTELGASRARTCDRIEEVWLAFCIRCPQTGPRWRMRIMIDSLGSRSRLASGKVRIARSTMEQVR